MPDYAEPRFFPCRHKDIDLVPRTKTEAGAAILQHAVHLREGRVEPVGVVIVEDLTAGRSW